MSDWHHHGVSSVPERLRPTQVNGRNPFLTMVSRKGPSHTLQRQMRSLATCLALVALLGGMSHWVRTLDVSRLERMILTIVLPSGDVTLTKVLWLLIGLGLASVHLVKMVTNCCPHGGGYQLVLRDEVSGAADFCFSPDEKDNISLDIETPEFHGQLLFRDKFQVYLHGQFKRKISHNSKLFLAVEVPVDSPKLKIVMNVLFTYLSSCSTGKSIHFSNGEKQPDKVDLPHFAVPLHLSQHLTSGRRETGLSLSVGKLYRFQMALPDSKCQKLLTMALALLSYVPFGWMSFPPVHFVAYCITVSSNRDRFVPNPARRHTHVKRYLFRYSLHQTKTIETKIETQRVRLILPQDCHVAQLGSPIHCPRPVPFAHAQACRSIAHDARALAHWTFSLPVWLELVDPHAGRRKVAYLFDMVDLTGHFHRTVLRSALTIKNTVILLHLEHQVDRKDSGSHEKEPPVDDTSPNLQHLVTESRAFRYDQIEHETAAVTELLHRIARQDTRSESDPHACYQNQLERATLYRCFTSPSHLPSLATREDLGVRIKVSPSIYEVGIYRLHEAGDGLTPLLRQEWLLVSPNSLHFYRSYSIAPALEIPRPHILKVACRKEKEMSLFRPHPHDQTSVSRWFGLELHLVLEILVLFVETRTQRDHLVQSLTSYGPISTSSLFTPLTLTSQPQPVCLNQRTSRFIHRKNEAIPPGVEIVEHCLTAGLHLVSHPDLYAYHRHGLVGTFLDQIERLNDLNLEALAVEHSSCQRFALGLNLYHILFLHAIFVFGYPKSHEDWKLLQLVPCYLFRHQPDAPAVRFTLADIQRVILRSPVPVTLEPQSFQPSLSPRGFMEVAIGGGGAIDTFSRTVLGIPWTPVFPRTSVYQSMKHTPLPIPVALAIDAPDLRTSLVLQINCSFCPPGGIITVYRDATLNDQLNATCTKFLSLELRLDECERVIYLPRVCEWYRMGHRANETMDERRQEGGGPHRGQRSSSSGKDSSSWAFYCLQRLLVFMDTEQHDRVMHLLLGAGDECRIVFEEFWTRPSRSAAVELLTSAGTAALSVFRRSATSLTGLRTAEDEEEKRDSD